MMSGPQNGRVEVVRDRHAGGGRVGWRARSSVTRKVLLTASGRDAAVGGYEAPIFASIPLCDRHSTSHGAHFR